MVDLKEYGEYWKNIPNRLPAITRVMGVTVDEEMGPRLQRIKAGEITLFYIVPSAQADKDSDADGYTEENLCVLFLMMKYDPQRTDVVETLATVQEVMEELKAMLMDDYATNCHTLAGLKVPSLSTIPETGFYGNFAGWSLGFTLLT